MDEDFLSWAGNFINFSIFVFLFTKSINTSCFSNIDMGLSMFGLISSIIIQVVAYVDKSYGRKK